MDKMIVRTSTDIYALPKSLEQVRFTCYLTTSMAEKVLKRCPGLKLVILTCTARKRSSKKARRILMQRGMDLICDYSKQGRPTNFTRVDFLRMKKMQERGSSLGKIAKTVGVSSKTVARALNGQTKLSHWGEDYNRGKSNVVWIITRDADSNARKLADNHYSRKTKGAKYFCGPGEKLVLITPDKKALFVWRKNKIRWDGQNGVECTIFRNECAGLSSELIKEAVRMARKEWPDERLFTYIDSRKIKSTNPGFCFKRAGWEQVDVISKKKKLIMFEAPK